MTRLTISSIACARVVALDQEQVALEPFAGREVGRRALPDGVRAADDHAPRGLAEDVGELGDRHDLVLDQLRERLARADRARAGRRRRRARRACLSPTARSSVTSSSRFAIEVSSTTSTSASISSLVGPWPGIQPSAEWIVEASIPVDSAIRRAARPVGATRAIDAFWCLAAAQIMRIVAVLPVPGPPVTIDSREAKAASTAAACSGAGDEVRRRRRSRGGLQRRPRSCEQRVDRQRQLLLERRGRRAGRPTACRRRPARARSRAWSAMSCSSAASGARRRRPGSPAPSTPAPGSAGTSSRRARPRSSTWTTAARRRPGASGPIPAARAIVSAIWNPTPNTLVSSYGRLRTISCARSPYSLAIRGTSHASPCGASSRCSARVERSSFQDFVASLARCGLSPRRRNASPGSSSIVVEHVIAVLVQQLRRARAADVADALEVGQQRLLARRRDRLRDLDLDLRPEALVVLPDAGDADVLALLEVGERPDEHDVVAVAGLGVDDRERRRRRRRSAAGAP